MHRRAAQRAQERAVGGEIRAADGQALAARLKLKYHHIDPLKIDLVAVTQTMSNAYAERYRILPVAVTTTVLTVATSEPFVRTWADELEQIAGRTEIAFHPAGETLFAEIGRAHV